MKNPTIAVFFAVLLLIVGYVVFISLPEPRAAQPESGAEPLPRCQSGQTQYCKSGPCSGVATCADGIWSGCRWDTMCTPGERLPCLKGACSYAVRECNSCGTGFGECFSP
ncbi:MAG TPA: hypothetical protein VLD37_05530 [Candidatus Bilamarchaeum sp.]|nr:hypothetical protein [Candidatus Bilamarchaeum sp.]